ncbi:MAG: hypothetical protein U1F66_12490 [bacterium]
MNRYFVWLFGVFSFFPSLLAPPSAHSQTLFQNNNLACEADPVLCSTGGCTFPDVNSLSCRNIQRDLTYRGADFNGDGFTDCVAAREASFNSTVAEPRASVLINRGNGATPCTPGPGSQFNPSLDYLLTGLGTSSFNGVVMAGDLNGGNSDFLVPNFFSGQKNMVSALNPGAGFGPDGSTLTTSDVNWELDNQDSFNLFFGQRNSALLDCDNDGDLDVALMVDQSSPSPQDFFIDVLRNNGSGLQPIAAGSRFDTNVATNFSGDAILTVNDFNNDQNLDVATAIFTDSDGVPVTQVATVCLGNGNCGFTCPPTPTLNLVDQHPGQDPIPVSIESGDFDGDTNADLVVSEPGLSASDPVPTPEPQGLQYYFGDGNGNFPRATFVPYDLSAFSLNVAVLTTGCFNNDNVRDVAVTSQDAESPLNNLGIFLSDGSGGIRTPFALFASGGMEGMRSVESADFDNAGGDDLMVLARNPAVNGDQAAFVFMNSLETLSAIAGADQTGNPNQALAVSGASCSLSPDDPTDPARFEATWTVTSAPPGPAPTLSGANTLTPTFQGSVPGVYTLQLQCRTRCTSVSLDTKNITLAGPAPTPVPTPSPAPLLATQGGCLANLTPVETGVTWMGSAVLLSLTLGLWCLARGALRKGR